MKKTFEELQEIDELVATLYSKNPKLKDGKFGYAYKRFYAKNIKPLYEELNEEISDLRVENALTDEKTKELLVKENGSYRFGKEGMKKLLEGTRLLLKEFNKKEVEIISFTTSDIPTELLEEQYELLEGCVIKTVKKSEAVSN